MRYVEKIVITLILLMSSALTIKAESAAVVVGAARCDEYVSILAGKKVGLLSNHTGMVGDKHTLDVMLDAGVDVVTLFSPEHGFRGTADAGEQINNSVDEATGKPIVSLYGRGKAARLVKAIESLDIVVVDLQDVGTRFYTYYITMLDVMNEAARQGCKIVVFDRPNPNGMIVDGPVLNMSLKSGVGRLPIPVLHGLTLGELAAMANGEGWLEDGRCADLHIITCLGYSHSVRYQLPTAPSPNLSTMEAVYLYPSLCYFEGTVASVGRGTDKPFLVYGHPDMSDRGFTFMPESRSGAKYPPLLGRKCNGVDLCGLDSDSVIAKGVDLSYVIDAYHNMQSGKESFFTSFFDKLIGNDKVRSMIVDGYSAKEIKATWRDEVEKFKMLRRKYLLYPEE